MIDVKLITPAAEGSIPQVVGGISTWVPSDVTSLVVQPFTSNSGALVTIIDTASIPAYASGLPLNTMFRLGLYTQARDTGVNIFIQQNSVLWARFAGAPLAISLDAGPQAFFSAALANVVGTKFIATGTGIQCQFGGDPGAIHLAGTMKLYLQAVALPAAV